MDFLSIEALALDLRRGAGFLDDENVFVSEVIAHWLGDDGVELVPTMLGRAALIRANGRYRIVAKSGATDLRFALAHELGHWALRVHAGATFDHRASEECAANTFAAVLLAPGALVQKAYAFFGERHETIATKLSISQTATVLRLGEVRGDPRAVVTRSGHVFVRNQNAVLDGPRAVRAARGVAGRGLAKARLRGGIDEGRVALRAV